MQHQLNTFSFQGKPVRTVNGPDGESRWVAKDVAEALGYKWNGNARIAHVPEEWRGVTSVVTPFGTQDMSVLTEAGLFFFLNRSDKPAALPFQKFVAGEVLPAIRRTGGYVAPSVQAGMEWPSTWKQSPAEKIEQTRRDSKGTYELLKGKVLPALERIEAQSHLLKDLKPKDAVQLLNAIAKACSNPRAYAASQRLFPDLFHGASPLQPVLPGMEEA